MSSSNQLRFCSQKNENYYLQVFLKECIYIEKEEKVIRFIIDNLESSSDDSDEKSIKVKYLKNVFRYNNFEEAILKMHYLDNNFDNLFFREKF